MLWNQFGFSDDIFFVNALKPIKEDIDLFVGREEEIKKFIIDTSISNRALKVISGKLGVGKTSFVNACQFYSYSQKLPFAYNYSPRKLLCCYDKIQINETDEITLLVKKALASIAYSIIKYTSENEIVIKDKQVKKIVEILTNCVVGSDSKGFDIGITIFGTGGNFAKNKGETIPNEPLSWRPYFEYLTNYIKKALDFDGVIVLFNNLEIISKSKIIRIFTELRDILFDIDNIYWVLIGHDGLSSLLETEVSRVAEYLSGTESKITPLEFEHIKKVIEKRVDTYKLEKNIKCPIPFEAIEVFHFLSLKEIRNTLKICSEVIKKCILDNNDPHKMDSLKANEYFIQYANERAREISMTINQVKILTEIFIKHQCRPKDYKEYGYETSSGFISALQSLVNRQLLQVEQKGKARYYSPTGMTMIAGLTGALGKEIQNETILKLQNAQKDRKFMDKKEEDVSQYYLFTEDDI